MAQAIRISAFLLLAIMFFSAGICAAATTSPESTIGEPTIGELLRVYKIMTSYRAEFTQVLTHKESGSSEHRSGTLLFKKPFLVRWETYPPYAELHIISDRDIWNYLPDEHLAYKYPPEAAKDLHPFVRVLTGQARLDQDFYVQEEGREEGLIRLRLYPIEPTQQITEALIWIDPKTHLIQGARSLDFFGNANEVRFTGLHPNIPLKDADFSFTPPPNTTIEDRR